MANPFRTENFPEAGSPRFEAEYAGAGPAFEGELRVISWNIRFSREIEMAMAELNDVAELRGADVLLLQEMDEFAVESIATALGYNYVYFPASIHCQTGRNFGNAILTKWKIKTAGKLLLPHPSPHTGEIRTATRAVISAGGRGLLTYSVHTETFALSLDRRQEQFQELIDDIENEGTQAVIVGGDFNTLQTREIRRLEDQFAKADMERASSGAGPTLKAGFLSFSLDHIFTRGMKIIDGGVWRHTRASDHFPLWQRLAFRE